MFADQKDVDSIKNMGHERHMVFLVDSFYYSDHFDQVLSCTSSQKGQI